MLHVGRFAESPEQHRISALTAIGEDDDDDDDDDDEEAEEEFFDTSIETLTARTTTRLRAASDRHVALKAERDDLSERKVALEKELRVIEAESLTVSKELEKLRERADRASRRAKKDAARRPRLEEMANSAANEAKGLLAARESAEIERDDDLTNKTKAESDLKQLRIRVTMAEQEITERKLLLVNAQDEAVGLRVQAKAAEETASRRMRIDLPAARVAHNDLREERDTLKTNVESGRHGRVDTASDVEALEKILCSTRGEVETQRVRSVYAVDELSTADEATRNATAQCDRHEAAAAFSLANQALESRDAIRIEENLAKRQLATTEQVHALERNEEELVRVLEAVRTRARDKCVAAGLSVDRACAISQERLRAESAAFDAAKASIQIQSERASHERTRLNIEAQETYTFTDNLEATVEREHKAAEQLRGRVGNELARQRDALRGPRNKLIDTRRNATRAADIANCAAVTHASAVRVKESVAKEFNLRTDGADAARCACEAAMMLCEAARSELVAASSARTAADELTRISNAKLLMQRDKLFALEHRALAAEADAVTAADSTARAETDLAAARAQITAVCN